MNLFILRFSINLQNGPKPENIALHFNPRWNDKSNPHKVTAVRYYHNLNLEINLIKVFNILYFLIII
jgi:hypothetical protein